MGVALNGTDGIVAAIREGDLSTRGLVLISYALAARGADTTSVLGQYGEELVVAAYGGEIESFDQKGYDVATASGERLQVKTDTKGRRAGVIRSFAYDVITVEIDPSNGAVANARRYLATDLFAHSLPGGSRNIGTSIKASPRGVARREIATNVAGRSVPVCHTSTSPSYYGGPNTVLDRGSGTGGMKPGAQPARASSSRAQPHDIEASLVSSGG